MREQEREIKTVISDGKIEENEKNKSTSWDKFLLICSLSGLYKGFLEENVACKKEKTWENVPSSEEGGY